MHSFDKIPSHEQKTPDHHIEIGGAPAQESVLQKVLHALYPQESIRWILEPDLKKIDTYVLFYVCPYGAKETPILMEGIQYAQHLLNNPQFNPAAHILMILYRDLKVAFPERKLRREKVMSEMVSEEMLNSKAPMEKHRIRVTQEFGTNNLQDTLHQLIGSHLYFEVMHSIDVP